MSAFTLILFAIVLTHGAMMGHNDGLYNDPTN